MANGRPIGSIITDFTPAYVFARAELVHHGAMVFDDPSVNMKNTNVLALLQCFFDGSSRGTSSKGSSSLTAQALFTTNYYNLGIAGKEARTLSRLLNIPMDMPVTMDVTWQELSEAINEHAPHLFPYLLYLASQVSLRQQIAVVNV